jgi:non-specific serine/threonine protein kinase
MTESLDLYLTPERRFAVRPVDSEDGAALPAAAAARIRSAFAQGQGAGLAHLATEEVKTDLTAALSFAREFATRYLTRVCHLGDLDPSAQTLLALPPEEERAGWALEAPPVMGGEYLDALALGGAWRDLGTQLSRAALAENMSVRAYLHARNPLWRLVGRVTFHLAENKRDPQHPFAFMATYAARVSRRGEAQHLPLGEALREYAGTAHRQQLVNLLTPIRDAAERVPWVQALFDSGDLYRPLVWTAAEAYSLLRSIPALEAAGLAVRIPDWWRDGRTARPQASARIGGTPPVSLGAEAMLDFSVALTLEGEPLTPQEQRQLLAAAGGLIRLRGRWVEADGEQLAAALAHWRRIERDVRDGGLSFFEGMRLLAGAAPGSALEPLPETVRQWSGIEAGAWLREQLARLRDPQSAGALSAADLKAKLRPYQVTGAQWLTLLAGLGLGACLADDMGLGKTLQVIALLLHLRDKPAPRGAAAAGPSLVVAPASLIANWKSEIARFAPSLAVLMAHPSETDVDLESSKSLTAVLAGIDVVITTYGMVARSEALRARVWRVAVLDEAQAIKNPAARQTRAVKQLRAGVRIALTGTPIENRLSDLWSLFDFLNPGLLGSAHAFTQASKRLGQSSDAYAPLRRLIQPYILRRLKTDARVIADLPEKTEVRAFCGLTREQAALYERCVRELARTLERTAGIQRRGVVLASLMQLKQICNHPAQWAGEGTYAPERSDKFQRLSALCEELAQRQERALVFTQFRELTEPLAEHLSRVFGRPGLVLHGGTPVRQRQHLVRQFQHEEGPPFFVLSLKAGGTGLNLTAASQVIHFDRWWNPAVESQATDRAFRIGQHRNVLVHKFVCRGTVEEKIDALIEGKKSLARELLDAGGERLMTEMSDEELLATVALDIHKACGT